MQDSIAQKNQLFLNPKTQVKEAEYVHHSTIASLVLVNLYSVPMAPYNTNHNNQPAILVHGDSLAKQVFKRNVLLTNFATKL